MIIDRRYTTNSPRCRAAVEAPWSNHRKSLEEA
jgi:hypothetical protein